MQYRHVTDYTGSTLAKQASRCTSKNKAGSSTAAIFQIKIKQQLHSIHHNIKLVNVCISNQNSIV